MNCKDCIHYDVCTKIGFAGYRDCIPTRADETCRLFKDRSIFVELPIRLGEEFHTIEQYGNKSRVRWAFAEEITICVKRGIVNGRCSILKNCFDFKIKPLRKKMITDLSNVFKTKEEAESAWNARNTNDTTEN